ncbi:MAG: GIY-YIG nuclease family protein [Candidatus Bathyarchaeia archaeon]|jgi:hypothetical protein
MEKLTIVWEKPFKFSQRIPSNLIGVIGVYVLEVGSQIYYVGKAEEQGGFKRAKDHLRGQMDSVGRCVFEKAGINNKDEVNIWAGWIEEGQNKLWVDDAEKLLTWFYDSTCNKTNRGKYNGCSLHLKNEDNLPPHLLPEIESPS